MYVEVVSVSDYSAKFVLRDSPAHVSVQWEVDLVTEDFSTPEFSSDFLAGDARWFTGFPNRSWLLVHARVQFADTTMSAFTSPTVFRTRGVVELGVADGFNQSGRVTGSLGLDGIYGELIPMIGFVPGGEYPELVQSQAAEGLAGDYGVRCRMHNSLGDYAQDSVPTANAQVVKYEDPSLVTNTAGPFSFLMIIRPELVLELPFEDVDDGAYEIFGSNGDHWWLYQRSGALGLGPPVDATVGPHEGPLGWSPLFYGGELASGQAHLIMFTFLQETADGACESDSVPNADRVITPGIACFWNNGVRYAVGHLRGDGDFPNEGRGAGFCGVGSHEYVPAVMSFETEDGILWFGRHSGDGDRNFDNSANGIAFAGIGTELAVWDGRLIEETEAADINAAWAAGDVDAIRVLVAAMDPSLFDPLDQPKPPEQPTITVATV